MEIAREETFGPVVPITRIRSDEEALAIANASPYGLLAAVWTRDLARGLRFAERVRAGWVNVNESTNYWESHLPFGGRSGSARASAGSEAAIRSTSFTEPKTVVVSLDATRPEYSSRVLEARSDVVGSLLRPPELLAARDRFEKGSSARPS